MDYSQYTRSGTPQTEKAVPEMVANNAGGFTFETSIWDQLDRFLVLGTEKGTYYASEREHTLQAFGGLERCIRTDGIRTVNRAVEISLAGRAPKNDPALFVIAKCAAAESRDVRRHALRALPKVARIGTHLFHFAQFAKAHRGWGRAYKDAVASWYNDKTVSQVAFQAAKYKQRDGWNHRDLIRLAHPKAGDPVRNMLYGKIVHPEVALPDDTNEPGIEWFRAAEQASTETNAGIAADLIRKYGVPRECVNTELLNDPHVWIALLEQMPLGALVRNLGKISSMNLTERYSAQAQGIVRLLSNKEALVKSRLHPISILSALNVYKNGAGVRGSLSWTPNQDIIDALNDAFYTSFENVTPSNKRFLIGLDISGSMWGNMVNGIAGLDAATAAGAMAMVTLRTEPQTMIKAFTAGGGWYESTPESFIDVNISKRSMLDDVLKEMRRLGQIMGRTDCALPMVWATKNKVPVDAFVIYTDNETYAGNIHPFEALKQYRQKMQIPAKLVVAGVTSTKFSIADPSDAGMLDVVGFDSAAPSIISDFVGPDIDSN